MIEEEYFKRNDECVISYVEYMCVSCSNVGLVKLSEKSKFKFFKEFEIEHVDPGCGVVRIRRVCTNCC